MTELYYQDINWNVSELVGANCTSLFGLTYKESDNHPEILFFELNDEKWHRCYIDTWAGYWVETKPEYLDDIILGDYDGSRKIDYLQLYNLEGQLILKLWCQRNDNSTYISIKFVTGVIEYREFDDEDKDGEILFIPSQESSYGRL